MNEKEVTKVFVSGDEVLAWIEISRDISKRETTEKILRHAKASAEGLLGGYAGKDLEVFRHGMQTIINVISSHKKNNG